LIPSRKPKATKTSSKILESPPSEIKRASHEFMNHDQNMIEGEETCMAKQNFNNNKFNLPVTKSENFTTSYSDELEIERYCAEDIPIINIPQTSTTKKINSPNSSSTINPNTEKFKSTPISNSLKSPLKNGPKQYKQNTLKKFIGKKKKYKHMSKTDILKDYYLNHCGLCRIRFKELDENLKLVKCDSCRLWICPSCVPEIAYDIAVEFKCEKCLSESPEIVMPEKEIWTCENDWCTFSIDSTDKTHAHAKSELERHHKFCLKNYKQGKRIVHCDNGKGYGHYYVPIDKNGIILQQPINMKVKTEKHDKL